MKVLGVVLAVFLGTACSSTPRAAGLDEAGAGDAALPPIGDAALEAHADATMLVDAVTAMDSTTVPNDDVSSHDAGSWSNAAPPSGYTRCGHGSFTPAEAATACAVPSFVLDQVQMVARSCSSVTLSGGQWEAWCGPTAATQPPYVRVEYDGLLADSGLINELSGWIDANGGGSGMTLPPGAGLTALDTMTPTDAVLQTLGNTQPAATGQANVFLLGDMSSGGQGAGTQAVISGASVSWNAYDGG
jgi:hypothetical protein